MSSTVEQIKERLGIEEVVSSYLTLEKAGSNLKARCPFHNEKTPSFYVSPDRGTFHCFGCGAGGDSITFVQEIEGVDFMGALKILAERAGVEIQHRTPQEKETKDRLFSVMEHATFYFESNLANNPEALAYLQERGMSQETRKHFRIGYAPSEWRSVSTFLLEKGFTQDEMERAGLIIVKDGRYYDRFRSRIMFPITDASGRVIAFSGRIFGNEGSDKEVAKYINSPETELYSKGRVLYGFDRAKMDIRSKNACILVEGQMDVVLCHQAGTTNAVASSGTALTAEQLTVLRRLTDNLVMAFDADSAGVTASGRGVDLALANDMTVKLLRLPKGSDPADLIQESTEGWQRLVAEARPIVDFYLEVLRDMHEDDAVYRRAVERTVLPYVGFLVSSIDQAHAIATIASRLGVREEAVWEEFRAQQQRQSAESTIEPQQGGVQPPALSSFDRRTKTLRDRLLGVILWNRSSEALSLDGDRLEHLFEEIIEVSVEEMLTKAQPSDRERMIFEAESYFSGGEDITPQVEELVDNLREHLLRGSLARALDDLKRAEDDGNTTEVAEILKRCHDLSRQINTLNHQKQES